MTERTNADTEQAGAPLRTIVWRDIDPHQAASLGDARRQLHHAAQLASAFGISYLPKTPDDSHTNLEWIDADDALVSREADGCRIGIRVKNLELTAGARSLSLRGCTVAQASAWVRDALSDAGLLPDRFTTERHYQIPRHRVDYGAVFDARDEDLEQLAAWYSNAALLLELVRGVHPTASEVRCWPHHFDLATLITMDGGRSIGAGMEPGDIYYDQPYLYVNLHPSPEPSRLTQMLEGGGTWHTHEWTGAVLLGSSVDSANQEKQARAFLKSAIVTATKLITSQ
jgi:hypothetical protein